MSVVCEIPCDKNEMVEYRSECDKDDKIMKF